MSQSEFDRYASSYERYLAKSLAVTGESREFYAQKRIDWTARCLEQLGVRVNRILDYGCGDGANAPMLASRFAAELLLGVDISSELIAVARRSHDGANLKFLSIADWTPCGSMDLAFTNGVFHHISPEERAACLDAIYRALRPAGIFAFWENNPWNPGTQYVMSQCAFDENAVKISPRQATKLLARARFEMLRTDSLFYFPRQLRFLRPLEAWLRLLPFGGQYLVLCRKA
ncbi:MAG TPA: class I SAM-dependent methyltransferase [Candidatus Sulfotelmatobacter sp.]|nr:class I SAM-dependent methyltransferase [Candidatus Sulfotelmatobacter sp.]